MQLFTKLGFGFLTAGAAVAFSAVALFQLDLGQKSPQNFQKPPKQDRIDRAIEQEFRSTADPATGEVPRDRLFDARRQADDLRKAAAADRSPLADMIWAERGPSNVGGRTRTLLVDRNDPTGRTVWAGSVAGGLWRTTTGDWVAPVWQRHSDALENMAVSTIAQHPTQPATLFFGTGEGFFNIDAVRGAGIWKSSNGGAAWSRLPGTANSTFHFVQKIVVAPSGHVFAATRSGGLQRSTDGGATWSKSLGQGLFAATNRAADVEIAANGDLFAAMGLFDQDGIYKSSDGGATWSKLSNGLPGGGFFRIELAAAPSDAGRIYALFQNSANSDALGIWASSDGGATWLQKPLPQPLGMANFCRNQAWYDLAAGVDPTDANRLVVGGIDLFRSSDGGATWSQLSHWYGGWSKPFVHADQHAAVFGPSGVLWVGNDGGIFRSTNWAGAAPTFSFAASGYNVTQYYGVDFHPDSGSPVALAGAQDNGTQRFDAADLGGAVTVAGGDGGFSHIDQNEPQIQIASYVYSNFFITRDNWATSQSLTVGAGNEGLFVNVSDYDDSANALFFGAANDKIGWAKGIGTASVSAGFSPISIENSFLTAISVAPATAGRLFVGTGAGEIFRIENAFAPQPTASKIRDGLGSVSCIAIEKANEQHLLATYSNYGVVSIFESLDGGATWSAVEGNLPDMPVRWAVFAPENPKKALLATEIGVWTTEHLNGNLTEWLPSNGGLANVRTDMVVVRPSDKMVLAATHGRGLFESNFFSTAAANCAVPTGLLASSIDEKSAVLSCQNDGQAAAFEFRFRPVGQSVWLFKSSASASASVVSLTESTSYEFQVRKNCPGGWTAFSASTFFKTSSPFVCEVAKGLTVAAVSNAVATLKWSAVAGATGYEVRWRRSGTTAWATASTAGLQVAVSGLLAAKNYEFAVKTSCGTGGAAAFSPAYFFTTSATATGCAAPHGLASLPSGATSAKIEWAVTPGAVGWVVRWKTATATSWTVTTASAASISLAGLAPGGAYQVSVAAKCSATSQSPFSAAFAFSMPAALGCQPEGNSADEWIERVQLADYQRVTGKNEGGYFCEMTAQPMRLPTGKSVDFEIEPAFSGQTFSENYAIWFDANGDGQFQNTPDEALFSQPTTADSIVRGQLVLPKSTRPGLRHLRVMMRYNPIASPCGAMAWGECEDYLIEIAGSAEIAPSDFEGFSPAAATGEDAAFFDEKAVEKAPFSASASPSPFREQLFIETSETGLARLFDGKGQLLGQLPLEKGQNEWPLDFLPPGLFALLIDGGKGDRQTIRVLKI